MIESIVWVSRLREMVWSHQAVGWAYWASSMKAAW